jgi:GWxTD domain-containing protein
MDVAALRLIGLLGVVALTAAVPARQGAPNELAVSAVRFYRPDGRFTQVKVFIQIPAMSLEPAGAASGDLMTYLMDVRVRDSTGLELVHNSWSGRVPAAARAPGVTALEILEFPVTPGRYKIEVEVTDSTSGRKLASALAIEGFRSAPGVSDLLLAPLIREVGPTDTVPAPGEIRRGDLLITGSAELRLTPLRSKAFYLVEAYNSAEDSARLAITVTDRSGKALVSTAPSRARLPQGGGVLTGVVDVAGLPAGEYRLTARLDMGGATLERTAEFSMAELSETVAKEADRREARRVTDEGHFASMTAQQLDAAAAPLSLIAKSGEMAAYKKDISLRAKQRFLAEFWARRDPSAGTPRNEMRETFYDAIAYADSNYRERGRVLTPGWKTDRGRIYTRHGAPDDLMRKQQEGYAPPNEIWRYSRGKGNYYIFADRTGVGGYKLIRSNDLQEVGDPNWQRIVGIRALEDIAQYLNLDRIELDRGGEF